MQYRKKNGEKNRDKKIREANSKKSYNRKRKENDIQQGGWCF